MLHPSRNQEFLSTRDNALCMDPPGLGGSGGDLRKTALKARMGGLPPLAALSETSEVGGEAPFATGPSGGRHHAPSTSAARGSMVDGPSILGGGGGTMGPPPARKPIAPVGWEQYWERRETVELQGRGTFNVYVCGASGPVVFCIHGGGYTGLTWSLVAAKLKDKYRIVAPDLRGHGLTVTADDLDFSKETMAEDIVQLWQAMFGGGSAAAEASCGTAGTSGSEPAASASAGPATPTPMLLVGHSMGGALGVWAASTGRMLGLEGVGVIDVVEGTALAALPYMAGVLASRPGHFPSLEEAIAWCGRTGMSKSKVAAAVSMPSQLRQEVAQAAAQEPLEGGAAGSRTGETDAAEEAAASGVGQGEARWVWRTPLDKSQPYWSSWYTGLSEQFLKVTCPKMLLLAGTDRLDKVLTIGQMQGKFQLALMPTAGHAIQEDEAGRTADHLREFLQRFRIGLPPMQIPRAPPGTRPVLPAVAGP